MEYYKKRILKRDDHIVEVIQPSNGGTVCDNYDGACSCGAWHSLSDEHKKLQLHSIEIIKFLAKIDLLKEMKYEPVNFAWQNISDL
jgi:hypothetical protein